MMHPRPHELELSEDDLAALNSDPMPEDRWKFYTVLQVPRTATTHEIELSYRRLSKVFHTDRLVRKLRQANRGITQAEVDRYTASARLTMSLLNQAKAVLTDPLRRAAYDRHGDDGLSMFESLDLAVRESAKPSEVLAMLDMLKGGQRQQDTDVRLSTSGAGVVLVDATNYVDVAIAKWLTGRRGAAQNVLLPLQEEGEEEEGFADVRAPYVKAVTVQHLTQAYASERVSVSLGAVVQGSQGLCGGKVFSTVQWEVTSLDALSLQLGVTDTTAVEAEVVAIRKIDEMTTVEAGVKHDFSSEDEGPSLTLRSRRKVDDEGTWVSADIDFATQTVTLGADGEAVDSRGDETEGELKGRQQIWEGSAGALSLHAGGVLERDVRSGKPKTTVEASLTPLSRAGSVKLTRRVTGKCSCSVATDVDQHGSWNLEVKSSFQFNPLTRFSVGASVGARGVSLNLTFNRGRSLFRLPILLGTNTNALVFSIAATFPAAALLLGRWFSLPYHAMLTASVRKGRNAAAAEEWAKQLAHAMRQQDLLRPVAQSSRTAEEAAAAAAAPAAPGLVVLEARYGCHNRRREQWLDVAVVLQAAVQDSKLVIPGGTTKCDVPGFVDPRVQPTPEDDDDTDDDEDSGSDDTDDSAGDSATPAERERKRQRRLRRQRRRQQQRFDDRPPRRLLPRVLWVLRHFFALPSVTNKRIQDSARRSNRRPELQQFLADALGDGDHGPADNSLVLAVRYSYGGKVYDIEFLDKDEVRLPNVERSRRVWTQTSAAPRQWAQ